MLLKIKGQDSAPIDLAPGQKGFWQRGTFSVPASVSEERVQLMAYKYIQRLGEIWERQGFKVHRILSPIALQPPVEERDTEGPWRGLEKVLPDRRKYVLYGWVSRRPQERIFDIPDELVSEMSQLGLKLA